MKQITGKTILLIAISLAILNGCGKPHSLNYDFNTGTGSAPQYPDVNFAVISDIHVYSAELGSSGAAFEKTMNSDRKLLLDSIDLLDFAIAEILEADVNFVLIPGDLTKDGELVNHKIVAEKLQKLTDADIAVYVVPGNHDVNNPDSVKYSGDSKENIPAVSEAEFAQIYGNFGYNAAFKRDKSSLSYVTELTEGMWLLALDATRHNENVPGDHAIVSGKINQETADWIASVLREAYEKNIAVMAMMHHGFGEHWKGQAKLHPDYIILDYANFGKFLASWNVRAGFTGHYHAHDITRLEFDNGKYFYDIETGSLITAPCPIRYVQITDNMMNIKSDFFIEKLHPGTDFAVNGHAFVKKTVMLEAANTLRRYKVSEKDTAIIADAVGDAFAAHYSGDENPELRPPLDKSKLGLWGRIVLSTQKYVLDGLWIDLIPEDINTTLNLK